MAPSLRNLTLGLPQQFVETVADRLRQTGGRMSPEVARALPNGPAGADAKDLQRWRTEMSVIFTTQLGVSQQFYQAEQWQIVQVMLETAGPVAISTRTDVLPVLSGKGRLLTTNINYKFVLPRGARLYYAAESVNRVAFSVEPIPWLEQLAMEIRRVSAGGLAGAKEIVKAVLRGQPARDELPAMPEPPPPASAPPPLRQLKRLPNFRG